MTSRSAHVLRRTSEVRRVLTEGRRLDGRRVVVFVLPSGSGRTRAAFACARKVGGAVARNRARRLMKEAWRANIPGARDGFDMVAVARPEIVGAGAQEITEDMKRALEAAGVLGPPAGSP